MVPNTLALGIIETWGVIGLIAAADAAAKTADVQVTTYEKIDAGIVTIYLLGDVSSVKTAVEAGAKAAKRVGKLLGTHVIPRPDASVFGMVHPSLTGERPAELNKMTVRQLRAQALTLSGFPLSEEEIKTASKALLLKLLSERDNDEGSGQQP